MQEPLVVLMALDKDHSAAPPPVESNRLYSFSEDKDEQYWIVFNRKPENDGEAYEAIRRHFDAL